MNNTFCFQGNLRNSTFQRSRTSFGSSVAICLLYVKKVIVSWVDLIFIFRYIRCLSPFIQADLLENIDYLLMFSKSYAANHELSNVSITFNADCFRENTPWRLQLLLRLVASNLKRRRE